MSNYVLYKVDAETIEDARDLLERALSTKFEERDSSFHRGPYYAVGDFKGERFELRFNMDPDEDVPNLSAFPDAKWLLYVKGTDRPDEINALLSKTNDCTLLRHKVW